MQSAKRKSRGGLGQPEKKKQQSKEQDYNEVEEIIRTKNLKKIAERPEEEKCLEELVFGDEDGFVEKLLGDSKTELPAPGKKSKKGPAARGKRPAWFDEDDEAKESVEMTHRYRKDMIKKQDERTLKKTQLKLRLQQEFQKAMGGVPSWASRDPKKRSKEDEDSDEEDGEDNLLSKTGNLLAESTSLPAGILQIKSCESANSERPSNCSLSTVQFHPLAQVVMTAGLDRSVSLFQVDGKLNPKIQSIYLEKFPVYKAQFSADGEQVIATGIRHRMFYVYDMMGGNIIPVANIRGLQGTCIKKFDVSSDGSFLLLSGSSGYLHMLSMKTKELIGSMKMNTNSTQAVFSPDSSKIFSTSDTGEVYIWDVKSRRCLNRFVDDGSLSGTSLAISKGGQYVSCGSSSGVVNVYNYADCLQYSAPKPLKSVMNLVTSASSQVFNSNTEILAVASHLTKNSVKLVHIPSFTVFANFPVIRTSKRIKFARALDFSPHSGFFSIANDKGEALLYRLKHYSDF